MLRASNATAVPRLLALICILSVFIPAFMMEDRAVAVHAADPGCRVRHDRVVPPLETFVPILCVALLRHVGSMDTASKPGLSTGSQGLWQNGELVVHLRWIVVPPIWEPVPWCSGNWG